MENNGIPHQMNTGSKYFTGNRVKMGTRGKEYTPGRCESWCKLASFKLMDVYVDVMKPRHDKMHLDVV